MSVDPTVAVSVARHEVVASLEGGSVERRALPEGPLTADALWRAVLAGLTAAARGGSIAGVRLTAVPGTVLWDLETLGSPRPVSFEPATAPTLDAVAAQEPHTWRLVGAGVYAVGPPASYLLARLTRGLEHAVDDATAAATGLLDGTGRWDATVCAALGLPVEALPELLGPDVVAGTTEPSAVGLAVPVRLGGLPAALS